MTLIPFDSFQDIWTIFLLVFVRITGMFFLSPIFGRKNIPNYYKAGFCFLFSILLANAVPIPALSLYTSFTLYIVLIAKELLIGLMLGFISYLIFSSIYVAGQMIDVRIGFGMVSVFDPVSNIQIPITADFYVIIATVMMLITDAHHLLIHALAESYAILPIGGAVFSEDLILSILRLFSNAFTIGFKIAAPVTVSILITDLALGIISKSMPQINVFMLGMPIKIIMGLLVIVITLGAFKGIVNTIIQGTYEEFYIFLRQARGP